MLRKSLQNQILLRPVSGPYMHGICVIGHRSFTKDSEVEGEAEPSMHEATMHEAPRMAPAEPNPSPASTSGRQWHSQPSMHMLHGIMKMHARPKPSHALSIGKPPPGCKQTYVDRVSNIMGVLRHGYAGGSRQHGKGCASSQL